MINSLKRIINETKLIESLKEDDKKMFQFFYQNNDLYHWRAHLYGPKDTPYEGYYFLLDIQFSNDYPLVPMKIRFMTSIIHPNINGTDICHEILKNKWNPSYNIRSVFLSLWSLLLHPNFEDAYSKEYQDNKSDKKEVYENRVKEYCRKYACKC
jgi:ubiquitin-protein ligase